jgi:hypothetical protein
MKSSKLLCLSLNVVIDCCRPEPEKNLLQLGMEKVEALSEEFMGRIR